MSFSTKEMPSIGVNTDFLGMSGGDAIMAISPQQSLLDYGEDFSDFGDSMFPLSPRVQPDTQGMEKESKFVPPAASSLNVNTTIPNTFGSQVPLQTDDIGATFYRIQQGPHHARNPSLTSPSIVMGELPFDVQAQQPGQYFDRDFINRGIERICLESSGDTAQSGLDIDLINKVGMNFNVQRPSILGPNMHGIVALRVAIGSLCQPLKRNPPIDADLLSFLSQGLSRVKDGSAPKIRDTGIDRPLTFEHLLMILHRYGLRNSEQYNLGIIRRSPQPEQFGAVPTYIVTVEGPKTDGSTTVWLYEQAGEWFPLAQDDFAREAKSYADAVKAPARPQDQRPTTPMSSYSNSLFPPDVSPSTPYTRSEAGSDATGTTSMSCRSCGRKFDAHSDLNHHMRNHRQRSRACPHCEKSFHWDKDLRRHILTHVDKDTRMDYTCQVIGCDKAYTRPDNLRRHYRQDHPGIPQPSPGSVVSSRHSRGSQCN